MSTGVKQHKLKHVWPMGVTEPVDCNPLGNQDTLASTDILWHSRNACWQSAHGQHEQTFYSLRQETSRYVAAARPIYSRENPPPLPENYVYLSVEEVAQADVLTYRVGAGWIANGEGHSMLTSEHDTLALAKPILSGTIPDPPEGFEVVKELDPVDEPNPFLFQVLIEGMKWAPFARWSDKKGAGDRILAKWVAKDDGLPIDILKPGDEVAWGDLVYDYTAKGWFPYIGPKEKVASALGLIYRGAGRLKLGFRPESFPLLRMTNTVAPHHQLLIKHDDGWQWTAPETEQIGRVAYMLPGVIALRSNGQPQGKPRTPVVEWMSLHLQNMLVNAPGSEIFRGLVRTSCRMVIPRELHQRGNSEEIKTWLEETRAANFPTEDAEIRVSQARQPTPPEEDDETDGDGGDEDGGDNNDATF